MKYIKIFGFVLFLYLLYRWLKSKAKPTENINTEKTGQKEAIFIVINGESNAGGMALNSFALPDELLGQSQVFIFNAESVQFENLRVGYNNNTGHWGLSSTTQHGFELGIANRVRDGIFGQTPIYILKTGQGASKIAEWADGSRYSQLMNERIDFAKRYFWQNNIVTKNFIVYTQGINDVFVSTDVSNWKNATQRHLERIQAKLGNVPILFVRFMNNPILTPYQNAVDELATSGLGIYTISSEGATLMDNFHWDYAGMKLIGYRIADKIKSFVFGN